MAVLDTLKRRIGVTGTAKDLLLTDLLNEATAVAYGDPATVTVPARLEPVIVWMAAAAYNQLGLEGEKSHSEGAISHSIDLMPDHLKALLNMYRVAKVGDA